MSVDFSLNLLISKQNLLEGLLALSRYEYKGLYEREDVHTLHGQYWYIEKSTISEMIAKVTSFEIYKDTSERSLTKEFIAQCDLKKEKKSITLWFTPWMQNIFSVTETGQYWLINLSFGLYNDIYYIPSGFTGQDFLEEVVQTLQPVYGWLEGDFTGSPSEYLRRFETQSEDDLLISPPWQIFSYTQIIGKPLSSILKSRFKINLSAIGLYYAKELGNSLFWITQPGDMIDRFGKLSEDDQGHSKAIVKLYESLKDIPVSVLVNDRQ
jgi:hypothetical protein